MATLSGLLKFKEALQFKIECNSSTGAVTKAVKIVSGTEGVLDSNLIAENIKKDVTILGVKGTYDPQ